MQIVKVRYHMHGTDELSYREYSYFSEEPLSVGDEVVVPIRDGTGKAQVTVIDVPEEKIAAFRDKVKIIPTGSRVVQIAVEPKMHILDMDQVQKQWESGTAWLNKEKELTSISDIIAPQKNPDSLDQDNYAITPQQNPDVLAQAERAMSLMLVAEKAIIDSDEAVKAATNDLSLIAGIKKELTAQKETYLKPLKDSTAKINEAFKMYMGPVTRADELLRGKILAYRQKQEADRKERERINALKIEAARAEMAVNGELSEPVDLVEETPAPLQRYRSDIGTTSTMKVRKWRIVDFSQIPDEYKAVDAGKVTKLVKAGIGSIPGIEIYEEETLQVRGA
ncbi:MAG: hypothetical protein KKF27_21100 [Gammaproteobacteria bacterium]|nr:hypothetical protein [Gammaproteobacteria bacterium]MBU2685746.1 hypothetical protein [Gammaproteobacteria bacterium]